MDTPRVLDGRLKLRHVVLVDALTEQGSIIGAAASLNMTQPAATRALHELESILGVELYERGPRGVVPTVFGTAFTEHARAVLAQLSQAGRQVAEIKRADLGTVVVGSHLAGATLVVPKAIASVKDKHPRLTVVVQEATPQALLTDLLAGRIDVVVGRVTAPALEGVEHHLLYAETAQLIVGAHHPALERSALCLADLLDYPWILPAQQTRLRQEVEDCLVRQQLSLPVNRIETTSYLTIRQLLLDTDVVAVLPSPIDTDDPRLAMVPVELEGVGHTVGYSISSNRPMRPATAVMIEELQRIGSGHGVHPSPPPSVTS